MSPEKYSSESIKKWQKRNEEILKYFRNVKKQIRLVGNIEYPAIIVNDELCMNAFIKKRKIYFTDNVSKGNVKAIYDLDVDPPISAEQFQNMIDLKYYRKIYKIRYLESDLFLYGFKSFNIGPDQKIFPLFAKHNCKIYFNEEHAKKILKNLKSYPVELK